MSHRCVSSETEVFGDNCSESIQSRGHRKTSGMVPRENRESHSPGRGLMAKPATQSSGQQPLGLTRARSKEGDMLEHL